VSEPVLDDRIAQVIRNAARLSSVKWHQELVWGFVSRLTGYGSTSSIQLCEKAGIDPHVKVKELLK
jgi:ribosomal protein S13